MNNEIDATDKSFMEMLERKAYTITVQPDFELHIEDEQSLFQVWSGQIDCMHKSWRTESDEVHQPEPHLDYTTKNALS